MRLLVVSLSHWRHNVVDSEAVEFTEFEPYYFRQIRLSVGITDEIYIK